MNTGAADTKHSSDYSSGALLFGYSDPFILVSGPFGSFPGCQLTSVIPVMVGFISQ